MATVTEADTLAADILAIVKSETDTERYAEMHRCQDLAIPLAYLLDSGLATPTLDGIEMMREGLEELIHYVNTGIWCGGVWGCPTGCGRPRTVKG